MYVPHIGKPSATACAPNSSPDRVRNLAPTSPLQIGTHHAAEGKPEVVKSAEGGDRIKAGAAAGGRREVSSGLGCIRGGRLIKHHRWCGRRARRHSEPRRSSPPRPAVRWPKISGAVGLGSFLRPRGSELVGGPPGRVRHASHGWSSGTGRHAARRPHVPAVPAGRRHGHVSAQPGLWTWGPGRAARKLRSCPLPLAVSAGSKK
jgi:hypothetical protein